MQPHSTQLPTILEEWRPVVGHEGWYEISSLGRARRVRRSAGARVGHLLKAHPNRKGYLCVVLYVNGQHFCRRIPRLVAEAFLGPCPAGHEVNHRNGIKADNCAANLEWATKSHNRRHAILMGLVPVGERCYNAKLTEANVRVIRAMRGHVTARELAHRFGVASTVILGVQTRRSWRHVS